MKKWKSEKNFLKKRMPRIKGEKDWKSSAREPRKPHGKTAISPWLSLVLENVSWAQRDFNYKIFVYSDELISGSYKEGTLLKRFAYMVFSGTQSLSNVTEPSSWWSRTCFYLKCTKHHFRFRAKFSKRGNEKTPAEWRLDKHVVHCTSIHNRVF